MAKQTMSAPLAIIKVNGVAIGNIRSLRFTENVNLAQVQGIGSPIVKEFAPTIITCSFSASMYAFDFNRDGVPGLENREVPTVQEYCNTIFLGSRPVDLYIYRKVAKDPNDPLPTESKEELFAVIRGVHLESTNFELNEGQVAGRNITGRYTNPIITPV